MCLRRGPIYLLRGMRSEDRTRSLLSTLKSTGGLCSLTNLTVKLVSISKRNRTKFGRLSQEFEMVMQAAALLLICVCAAVALFSTRASASMSLVQTSKWSLCASKTYAVKIKDILISPDPVEAGKDAFTIPAYANEPLDGGTVVVTVSFHGKKVHTRKYDLCSKSTCLITGDFTLNNSEPLPAFTPPGAYKLKFQILDTAGKELTCASINFNIVWKAEFNQLVEAASALEKKLGRGSNFPLDRAS